jgi:hypothetical protein
MHKFYYRSRETGKLVGYVPSVEEIRDQAEIDALNHGPQKRFAGWGIGLFLFVALLKHWAKFEKIVEFGAIAILWGGGALVLLASAYEGWIKHRRTQVARPNTIPGVVRWAAQNRIRYWLRRPLVVFRPDEYSKASPARAPVPPWIQASDERITQLQNESPAGPRTTHSHFDTWLIWAPSASVRWLTVLAIVLFLAWDSKRSGAPKCDASFSPSPHCVRDIESAARSRIYAARTQAEKMSIVEATTLNLRSMRYPPEAVEIAHYHLMRAVEYTEEYRAALRLRARVRAGFPEGQLGEVPDDSILEKPAIPEAPSDSDTDDEADWDST